VKQVVRFVIQNGMDAILNGHCGNGIQSSLFNSKQKL
jgi:hypothetical protein